MELLIQRLRKRLAQDLPGIEAQQLMMPMESTRARFDLDRANVRLGGVLILIYKANNQLYIPLTQRHDYGGTHSGQVSLPGGKFEEGDQDIIQTALRETHEEIGIPDSEVEVIGTLTDLYIPPSNFRVTPVVGFLKKENPIFTLDEFEVKELIKSPLSAFQDDTVRKRKTIHVRDGFRLNAPYFDIQGKVVWGATAMILSEFSSILSD